MMTIRLLLLSFYVLAVSALSSQAMTAPKKILLAFDGTQDNARDFLHEPDNHKDFSNVLKLHLLAGGSINNDRNDIDGQICLYKRGLGGESQNKLIAARNTVMGILSQQTVPMREMLEEVYEEGDELFIVGFSRGSSSARAFVVDLDENGLKTAGGKTVDKPPVKFLGCFDTVSDQIKNLINYIYTKRHHLITKPSVLGEKDGKLSPIVETAVHNVAMDDNRQFEGVMAFPPVLMDSADDRVHEAWFPGEHGDIGGSVSPKGLADGSLKSMQEWMEKCGLKFLEKGGDIHPDCLRIKIKGEEDKHGDPARMDIVPDPECVPSWQNTEQWEKPSFRLVVGITNEAVIQGGTVRVHKSYLDHVETMEKTGAEARYRRINDELLHCADVVVVGSLDEVLEDETQRLKAIIEKSRSVEAEK